MSKIKNLEETQSNLETADLVFIIDSETGSQHISLSDKMTIPDALTAPFRLAVHLNSIIEAALKEQEEAGEGQESEAVAEDTETEN
jgi:hypothetical protein